MTGKKLLGTSALVGIGVGFLATAGVGAARAAEVTPGGALDVTVSGFIRTRAHFGDLDNARLDDTVGHDLDFSNDTEVHVIVKGKSDATGLEYGGTVEFEADTDATANSDETWVFVRGDFGEVRLGDVDGVIENSLVGGQTIAAGTGGIDGDIVDTLAQDIRRPAYTEDATKIRYYTPSFGGLTFAISYTPNQDTIDSGVGNGDNIASTQLEAGDIVESGFIYEGSLGGLAIEASILGSIGEIKSNNDFGSNNNDYWSWIAGASVDVYGFKIAGSYWQDKIANRKRQTVTAGIGAALGPANVSLTGEYGLDQDNVVIDTSDDGVANGNEIGNHPFDLVASADLGLLPGLVLAGDVGWFSNDVRSGPKAKSDDGYQAVLRLGLAF